MNIRRRLCIPKTLEKNIFSIIYNEYAHAGFYRTYDTIIVSVYIKNLFRRFRIYIIYYSQCQLLQTTRHTPFKTLYSIIRPPIPFYTVTADFILVLLKTKNEKNYMLTITYKFFKKIELIPGKNTYIIVKQAKAFFAVTTNQSILSIFIGDRDAKQISEF